MAQSGIFNIAELLEQILHFLVIDKSLYPALFVCQLWYRCSAPILWKCVELKGNDLRYGHHFPEDYNYYARNRTRLKRFVKIMCKKHKPAYVSNLTHLEITYYYSLSDKKIKSIVNTFSNIIHLVGVLICEIINLL